MWHKIVKYRDLRTNLRFVARYCEYLFRKTIYLFSILLFSSIDILGEEYVKVEETGQRKE